jgi:Flp pilus assembly protein TadD
LALIPTDLAYGLLDENKPEEALAASQKGIDLDPQSPSAHSAKCYILESMKKPDEAKVECDSSLSILRNLVETDPNNASSLVRLGFILRRMGKAQEAMTAFQAAVDIAPHDVLTHIDLGRGLLAGGDRARAMTEFQAAILLDPNLPSAHEDLSVLLHQMGDHVGADLEADKASALRELQ